MQVAWALGTAMSTTVDSDDDLESIRDSLPPQLLDVILKRRPTHPDLVTRCEDTWVACYRFYFGALACASSTCMCLSVRFAGQRDKHDDSDHYHHDCKLFTTNQNKHSSILTA